jgi:hypothetical protein
MSVFREEDHPRDKEGEFTGEGSSFTPTKPFNEYLQDNQGNHVAAARNFYRNELQGKAFTAKLGEFGDCKVQVIPANLEELRTHMRQNPVKAVRVSRIPEILETGTFVGRVNAPGHAKYGAFHTMFKEIETDGKRIKAMLDIGEKNNGLFAYSLNHEGAPTWEGKKRRLREMEEQGRLKGGAGTTIPGFDATFVRRVTPLRSQSNPGISKDRIAAPEEGVNLFIAECVDIATGRRLREYEDGEPMAEDFLYLGNLRAARGGACGVYMPARRI